MCLSEIWSDEEMNEWLAGQGEVIEVWKTTGVREEGFSPACASVFRFLYGNGHQLDKEKRTIGYEKFRYWTGFHFFINKEDAEDCAKNLANKDVPETFLLCLVRKEWITSIGKDHFGNTIIASQAIFPHYPETEARYEDIEPFLEKKEEREPVKARMTGESKCLIMKESNRR